MHNGEKQKGSVELGKKSEWSELEGLAQDGPLGDNISVAAKNETQEEKQRKISQAAAKVRESYKKSDTEVEIAEEKSLPQEQSTSVQKKKLSRYDAIERSRVDRIKSDLNFFNVNEYERKQIASQPSPFTKTVRLITDRLGIKTKKSEERREREAMHIALNEHREEMAAMERAIEEKKRAEALERERRNAEYEAEKARREEEALARDMAIARDAFDYDKRNRFKKQRIQEIVERDLNSRLLTVDNLETEVLSENSEVQKRSVSFEGVDIPIYDLKGFPFSLLSTTIDYRSANKLGIIGTETFRKVLEDPSVWVERRDEAEKASGFGTRNSDARGNTISTSYWNSERNIDSHVSGNLIYGFEHVQADSIISVHNGDGGTSNMAGDIETTLSDPDAIKILEGAGRTNIYHYNEVLLRRYTENGMPKRPDYIIVENGRITEESLRHAKYFGIPIVNIERSVYEERAEKRGEELLASISEDDTYEEMDGKIAELLSVPRYKSAYRKLDGIGRNSDIPRQIDPTPLGKRCLEVSQMEQLKRLDFVKSALEEATRSVESATERGLPMGQEFPGFERFHVSITDVQKQLARTKYGDEKNSFYSAPGNCNWIDIDFRLKGSSRYVETRVYDGERIYKAEEALVKGRMTEEDIENADSSFYDTLEPVVLRYFEAIRKNRESS